MLHSPTSILLSALLMLATSSASASEFSFDRVHSRAGFEVSHLGFSMSQGNFHRISGSFQFDPKHWSDAGCDVLIDVASLQMGDDDWNRKLLGKAWFDADNHPQMRFQCDRLEQLDDSHGKLHGKLTLLDVTRPVVLDLTLNRIGFDKYALGYAAGFSARTQIRRSDFGMDQLLGKIGDDISIRIEIEAKRKAPR